MGSKPHKKRLTPAQARRAIYIDFEGPIKGAPALLGALYNSSTRKNKERWVLRQYILDKSLRPLHCAYEDPQLAEYFVFGLHIRTAIPAVLHLAKTLDRKVVSYSDHELKMVERSKLTDVEKQAFRDRYIDGKETAKHWLKDVHPDDVPLERVEGKKYPLSLFLKYLGLEYPEGYGAGEVSGWIRETREAVKKRESWDALLPSQQERWQRVLAHNAFDCFALRDLAIRAATELSEATAHSQG